MDIFLPTYEGPNHTKDVEVVVDNEPWFNTNDLVDLLGLSDRYKALESMPDDELRGFDREVQKGPVTMTESVPFVNEPGMYRLIFKSRKDEAERIKRWVFHEVLPEIRETGSYNTPNAEYGFILETVKGSTIPLVKVPRLPENHRMDASPATVFARVEDVWNAAGYSTLEEKPDLHTTLNRSVRLSQRYTWDLQDLIDALNTLGVEHGLRRQLGLETQAQIDGEWSTRDQWVSVEGLSQWLWRGNNEHVSFAKEMVPAMHRHLTAFRAEPTAADMLAGRLDRIENMLAGRDQEVQLPEPA